MRCSEGLLATEAGFQVSSPIRSLADSLYSFGCVMLRKAVRPWRRSVPRLAACPPPPSLPSEIHNPPFPDDDTPRQYHSSLAQKLRPFLSPICDWLSEGDVQIVGERPFGAGGFADIWRGCLDSREVAVKSYRRYLSFDLSRVSLVGLHSPIP